MSSAIILLAAVAAFHSQSVESAAPSAVVSPDWLSRPTAQDVERVYPMQARRRGVQGGVIIRCAVTAEGTLVGCQVEREQPHGHHFGEAALKLVPTFSMRPLTRGGAPAAGGVVRIPILFRLPQ